MTLRQGHVHDARHPRYSYGITDIDRPQPRRALDADDLAAWAEYERANKRARNEYAAHPIAACTTRNCPELALDGDIRCRPCKRFRDKGVRRNRAWRAKQKEKAK